MSSSISAKEGVDESICVERKIKPRTIDPLKLHPGLQQCRFTHVEPARKTSGGALCHTDRPLAVQPRPWRGGWRCGCRVSKHSPTILTAWRPKMCKKEKEKKKKNPDG